MTRKNRPTMKKILFAALLPLALPFHAQTLITTAGAEGSGIVWSVGEAVVTTLSDPSNEYTLTQGFFQPEHIAASGISETRTNDMPLRVYPNPVKDRLFVEIGQPFRWNICDMLGKQVAAGSSNGEYINVEPLANGYYILTVRSAQGAASTPFIK